LDGYFTFNPKSHPIDKFICYSNQIKNVKLFDRYPSYDYKNNARLFNIGKMAALKHYKYS